MTRDHSLIEELLSAGVLGGLSPEDAELLKRERESHGECEECARLEAEYRETAGRIGFSLKPVAGPGPAPFPTPVPGAAPAVATSAAATSWWKPVIAIAAALAVEDNFPILRFPVFAHSFICLGLCSRKFIG
jgi:anti-sigma factor RsiW